MKDFEMVSDRIKVPHDPVYAEYRDRRYYEEGIQYQFFTLIDAHRAWLVMLVEQAIVPREDASRVLAALQELEGAGPQAIPFRPEHHDIYTHMEVWLRERAGRGPVGHLSLARTRPEPLFRMHYRERILAGMEALLGMRATLLNTAEEYRDAVMPGYTHQQHAQPTTLGAYLLAIHDPLQRASQWLEMAYRTTNECTLGCGALAGTSFPIDRYRVSELLGFDDIMLSTFASVSTGDHVIQAVSAASDALITLSRMCMDLEVWANSDTGFLEPAPQFSDVSSMMPQKKNPCVFEIARAVASRAVGDTVGVYMVLLKAFYMDNHDLGLSYGPGMKVLDELTSTCTLLSGVMQTLVVHRARMLEASQSGFSTASALADEIFRQTGLPHRQSHSIIANLVTKALEAGMVATDVTATFVDQVAEEVHGRPLGLTAEQVSRAMDPVAFVENHDLPGGPAPAEVSRVVEMRRRQMDDERSRVAERRERLDCARQTLSEVVDQLIRPLSQS